MIQQCDIWTLYEHKPRNKPLLLANKRRCEAFSNPLESSIKVEAKFHKKNQTKSENQEVEEEEIKTNLNK